MDTCDKCKKPITEGQGRYTALESQGISRHWDCHEKGKGVFKQMDQTLNRARGALDKLKRRFR